jgi:hypothetical protein
MHINLFYYGKNAKTSQAINRNKPFDITIFKDVKSTLDIQKASKNYLQILRNMISNFQDDNEYRIVIDDLNNSIKSFRKESENNFERILHLKIIK